VLDASIATAWALPDENDQLATAAIRALDVDPAAVPALFWFEIRNALVINERRGRLTISESLDFLSEVDRLPIRADREPDSDRVLDLARRYRLTVYDAAYLELAQRLSLPLATLDQRLAAAASEAIPSFEP
jgi:predicted nucleic acid-binding protein